MSSSASVASGGSARSRAGTRTFVAALILVGLAAPFVSVAAALPGYVYFVGPPLDFDAPHDGQVVAHIDVLGKQPPDIARIRISEAATGVTVWDVTPTTARTECWNGCWNLTLRAGVNAASFAAGRQRFAASVPQTRSFALARGPPYLFEVWDSRGRVARERCTL